MKTIFLDRDGVINKNLDNDYVKSWAEFEFLANAKRAISRLTQNGYEIIVITNQAGVNKNLVSADMVEEIHCRMIDEISAAGGIIKKIYYCPHRQDENCECRKPKPGMLLQASQDYDIELDKAYLVGDSMRDIEAGASVGCKTILVVTGHGAKQISQRTTWKIQPDYIVEDLSSAVDIIINKSLRGQHD